MPHTGSCSGIGASLDGGLSWPGSAPALPTLAAQKYSGDGMEPAWGRGEWLQGRENRAQGRVSGLQGSCLLLHRNTRNPRPPNESQASAPHRIKYTDIYIYSIKRSPKWGRGTRQPGPSQAAQTRRGAEDLQVYLLAL